MALTLNIGGGALALVQAGAVVSTISSTRAAATLATPSTVGNLLVLIAGNGSGGGPALITGLPSGWVLLKSASQGAQVDVEAWAYPGNAGGISAVAFTTNGISATWHAQLSEWSHVVGPTQVLKILEGAATSTSGTTLVPTTTSNVTIPRVGDLALSLWHQYTGVNGTVTFTTPTLWHRVVDDGSVSQTSHLDAEYHIVQAEDVGAPLGPTLTSTGTTASAAGVIVVLRQAPPAVDQTAYLKANSQTIKLNTFDFALVDPLTVPSLGDAVSLTNPTWNGRIVSITLADIVDRASGHKLVTITATNQAAVSASPTAPGDLSDAPTGGYFLLEDGSGKLLLEDGSGYYELEGTSYAYRRLSVKTSQNQNGSTSVYGSLETFETGYAPGQSFLLTSANLGYSAQSFTITNVSQAFVGLTTPVYQIEFGDAYQTMQLAGGGVLTKQASQANIQAGVAMPGGTLDYATVLANQGSITTLTDLTGLTVTVTVGAGRRIRVSAECLAQSTVASDIVGLQLMEGASILQTVYENMVTANNGYTLAGAAILTPSAGAHTYKLAMQRVVGTGTVTMNAGAGNYPAFIMVEDIGT